MPNVLPGVYALEITGRIRPDVVKSQVKRVNDLGELTLQPLSVAGPQRFDPSSSRNRSLSRSRNSGFMEIFICSLALSSEWAHIVRIKRR